MLRAMRLLGCVLVLSAVLLACGDDGSGSSFDASSPDARVPDARTNDADNFVCSSSTTNPGFTPPSAVVQAYTPGAGGEWVLQGPADFSCFGNTGSDVPTTMALTLSGKVRDFQTGNDVPNATVAAWQTNDTSGTPVTATSDQDGNYSLILPAGARRPAILVTATEAAETYIYNSVLPNEATHRVDVSSLSQLTLNALPAFVGLSRTPGLGIAAWALVDCQGRAVANAIATVSSTSAVTSECTTHLTGANTFYFSAGTSTSLPVRHSQQNKTNKDGLFIVLELPPTPTAYMQVWGYREGQTPGATEPHLLAELPILVEGDSVNTGTIDPTRAD